MLRGQINSFHSMSTVDGPGLRVVAFMQGCPLRCKYCHNPETQGLDGGSEVMSGSLINKVLRYKDYMGVDGGLTVSGGEPLLQMPFIREVFAGVKAAGLTTCIETSGQYLGTFVQSIENLTELLCVTDYIYCDLKFTTDELYREHTGGSIAKTFDFIQVCEELNKQVIIRQVVVPGINDNTDAMDALAQFTRQFNNIQHIELLPYSKIGQAKYVALGRKYELSEVENCCKSRVKLLQKHLDKSLER